MTAKNSLILGGAGYIGSQLANRIAGPNMIVTILGKSEEYSQTNKYIKYEMCDLLDKKRLKQVFTGKNIDYIFNASGYVDHSSYYRGGNNVIENHFAVLMNVLDVIDITKLKTFIQLGSSDEYGNAPSPQHENLRELPITPYAAAKTAATHLLQSLYRNFAFPVVITRLFLVYGPGQKTNRLIPFAIDKLVNNQELGSTHGEQVRDFCYIDDVLSALEKCMDCRQAYGEVINIASGIPIQVKDVIYKISEIVKSGKINFGNIPYRDGESMSLYADIKKAKRVLEWEPKISIDKGLQKTIDSFR